MKYYTSAELERIAQMRADGFKWRTIAERFGRSVVSIRQVHLRAKKPIDHRHAENEAIVSEFVEARKTVKEIAAARGWSWSRVCMRLTRAGLDAELRQEVRDGRC